MKYSFPTITHMDQVIKAIQGHDEFKINHDENLNTTTINYYVIFKESFPEITSDLSENEAKRRAILRECRGITFDSKSGRVLNRKFHKFFNVNERTETQEHNLDLARPHVVLEKMDGSMITPILIQNQIIWCSKAGVTFLSPMVNDFVINKRDKNQYEDLAMYLLEQDITPIFEFCSRQNKIVIDYPVTNLILLAARHNVSGAYLDYKSLKELSRSFCVPLVAMHQNFNSIISMMTSVRGLSNSEGVIVKFDDGHMIKLKAEAYVLKHKLLESLRFEKDVIAAIAKNEIDDIIALMPPLPHLSEFKDLVLREIADYAKYTEEFIKKNSKLERKEFYRLATQDKKISKSSGVTMKGLEGKSVYECLMEYIIKNTGSQTNLDKVSYIWNNHSWYNFSSTKEE